MPTPTFPFHITGTATGADSSYKVKALNKTSEVGCAGQANNDSQYIIDLANSGSYSVGDVIKVFLGTGNQAVMTEFTITQAMIDDGGNDDVDMTVTGIREHVYTTIYNLINGNKPSSFTDIDGSTTVTWTITSAFPEVNPSFPAIVINPASVTHSLITADSSQTENQVELDVDYFVKAKNSKQRVDNGRDSISNTVLSEEKELEFAGLYFMKPDFIEDSNIDNIVFEEEKLNVASQSYKFKWTI